MTKMFGIKNCDTIKKAKHWLEAHSIPLEFHDYKSSGISADKLKQWLTQVDYQTLLNTRGTTWRKLTDAEKANIDPAKAIQLMTQYPSLIKRPVLETKNKILVGFNESTYQETLA